MPNRPAKFKKMCDNDENVDVISNSNNKRWSAVETDMKPEILEDMGVKMLEEEEEEPSCNQNKITSLQESHSLQPLKESNSETSTVPSRNDQRISSDLNEEFFLFRRKQPLHPKGADVFSKLSDEMVLMIFRWLPKSMLVRCSLVCKRWLRIAYDEVLWTRMDLGSKALTSGSLGYLLTRGTVILRLSQAEIPDPVFLKNCSFLTQNVHSKLQYLDLSMAVISEEGLVNILNVCRNLRKLSLEHSTINEDICKAIGLNWNLDVLNMSACYGVTTHCVRSILHGCKKLSALNLAWTNLSKNCLDNLAENCPDLVELDLSDCTSLTGRTIEIVQLQSVSSLMYLDIFNLMSEQSMANLQQKLPEVDINKFLFSSVARPTVGIRRTSIWGLRVRD
ncbi:hypothetical protein C0J52_01896 [Blattella germanica]|nr:hypothetical protein C0J52_01896 [Blattella germanica]